MALKNQAVRWAARTLQPGPCTGHGAARTGERYRTSPSSEPPLPNHPPVGPTGERVSAAKALSEAPQAPARPTQSQVEDVQTTAPPQQPALTVPEGTQSFFRLV